MSFQRFRHVFTLGSLKKSKRWQLADPFEGDPFKIRSYSFRYAERPFFPLPGIRQSRCNNETLTNCHYYNHDFPTNNNNNLQAESTLSLNRYSATKDSLNNNYIGNSSHILASNTSQISNISDIKPHSSRTSRPKSRKKLNKLAASSCANYKRSLGPGCEININIKNLEDNSLSENVNIKIETDSMSRNLYQSSAKTLNNSNHSSVRINPTNSANNCIMDKRLPKFCSTSNNLVDARRSKKERLKELNSVYSSQSFTKSFRSGPVKSLIPLRKDSFRGSSSSALNENLGSRKSMIQRVRDNLSVYDKQSTKKSCSQNNLNYSSYKVSNGSSARLSSASSTRIGSGSNARLPLNININVFADKLKLLKV